MEGGFGCGYMLTTLGDVEYHKQHVANLTVEPCGLGCQQLGPSHYACSGNTSVRGHFALGRIISRPAPLLYRTGEDDSPKSSCNK